MIETPPSPRQAWGLIKNKNQQGSLIPSDFCALPTRRKVSEIDSTNLNIFLLRPNLEIWRQKIVWISATNFNMHHPPSSSRERARAREREQESKRAREQERERERERDVVVRPPATHPGATTTTIPATSHPPSTILIHPPMSTLISFLPYLLPTSADTSMSLP